MAPQTLDAAEPAFAHRADPRWQLTLRILASPEFVRSPRLCDFLRYVTQQTLSGNAHTLSEQHIGETLFGRAASYDSGADTIVRSHALRLRRRLQRYFEEHGSDEPLWLEMPRGSYGVLFSPPAHRASLSLAAPRPALANTMPAPAFPPASSPTAPPQPARPGRKHWGWVVAALGLIVLMAATVTVVLHLRADRARLGPPQHEFWSRIFTADRPTHIVLGDSGLVLFHAVTHSYVSLDDYLHHNYAPHLAHLQNVTPEFALFLTGRRYTSMVDADAERRLTRLPQAAPGRTLVRYARDMRLDDFKNGNLVLLGAQESDPWVELFQHSMDFVFEGPTDVQPSAFLNRHPLPGEPAAYRLVARQDGSTVYAVVAFVPNLSASGNVLILEGLNMAGTEAALDFVLDDARLLPLLRTMKRQDGSLPHFEIMLATSTLTENATPARIVSVHVHNS